MSEYERGEPSTEEGSSLAVEVLLAAITVTYFSPECLHPIPTPHPALLPQGEKVKLRETRGEAVREQTSS